MAGSPGPERRLWEDGAPSSCTAQAPAQPAEIWHKGGTGEGAGAVPRDGHGGAGFRRSPCAPLVTVPGPQGNLETLLNQLGWD